MFTRIIISILLLAGITLIYSSFRKGKNIRETPIDKEWWDGLSEEWKTILLINQTFNKQGVDFFAIQSDYSNRMNAAGEGNYSALNKSLYELHEINKFSLSYTDFFARALRRGFVRNCDSIDLPALTDLDRIYMVNGPGDLTPLKKFQKLKVLIMNYCGADNTVPINKQTLDLEPLRNLRNLAYLQCSSPALQSLEPINGITNLSYLHCDNSSITSLVPLKKLVNLKGLSFGSKVKDASVISLLTNLQELVINGCKKIPDLSKLKMLKKLSIAENEMAIVNAGYRITDIGFLNASTSLEYLDLHHTGYKGELAPLQLLQQLKAIALPPVKKEEMKKFEKEHRDCIIINAFEYEK